MNTIRISLIEDEPLSKVTLKKALMGYPEVEWVGDAQNGKEGLNLLKHHSADVALVDIGLPDANGIDLIKQFKAESSSPTKIIVLTLHEDEESVLAAFEAGADSYCMKNSAVTLLWEAIKATHEGNAWIDPAIARIVLSKANKGDQEENEIKTTQTEKNLDNHPLTDREMQVLQLIVNGYSNAEISEELFITVGTVKTHVRNILNKLSAGDRTQAAVHALRSGMVG